MVGSYVSLGGKKERKRIRMAWLYWPQCIVSVNEIVILMGCILLALFLISCLYKIYVALDAQIRARPCFLKKKAKTKSFIICVFTIHWIKDIDCSSSRFRESTSMTIPNGFSTFYDLWTTKMLDRRVSFPPLPVHPLISLVTEYMFVYVPRFAPEQ